MSECDEWVCKMNMVSLFELRIACNITRVGSVSGKNKSMLSLWATWFWLCLHSCTVFTWELLQSCGNYFFFSFFQFRLCGFWLNKAVEGITNFASGFGGYLSLYVVWGIDFLPPTTLMKLLLEVPLGIHLVLITLSYLIWSLFKQEWILRFASGVCLSKGPFLLVFVFKVKAWLMWLIFPSAVLSSHVEALWLFKNIKTHQTVGYTFFLKTLAAFSSSSVQLLYLTIYT